ncbi:hypothetical protein L207DRAFT_605012 [Hyaloscypha variabilis F]|uniref:Luciferase domain-containing protein n=1 Tax=Hyaloscypha variabilis (strain UAMH 11265 / GT02V1 / F) TaxID=1149755 RepID=A0A2J6R790_HYAVF|nr:hypothetical protein L207DRAFT_605012 [Hyaloscypha variabilis F]
MARLKFLEWESTPTYFYHTDTYTSSDESSIIDMVFQWLTYILSVIYSQLSYAYSSPVLFTYDAFRLSLSAFRSLHWLYQMALLTYVYVLIAGRYQAYLNLGRGGTPSTFAGFLRVTRLRAYGGLWNIFQPPPTPPDMHPYRGKLDSLALPQREGQRPYVGGIAPQRQLDQKTPPSTFNDLLVMFREKVQQHQAVIEMRPSFLEGRTTAIFARPSQWTHNRPVIHQFGYEISHPHKNDGSLHMVLHPEDVGTIIEKGWGERHPLARGSWYWRIIHWLWRRKRTDARPSRPPVPEYLCFIYAPRNDAEKAVIETLLNAAIWFATGYDPETGVREEEELTDLPAPETRAEKKNRDEMSKPEHLNDLCDRFSDWFDSFSDVAWKWFIRIGSVAFVIWIMGLHTVLLRSFVFSYWGWVMYRYNLG